MSNQKKIWVGFVCVWRREEKKKPTVKAWGGYNDEFDEPFDNKCRHCATTSKLQHWGDGVKKKGFSKYKLISNIVCVEEGKTRKHNYYHYYLLLIFFYFYFNFFCFFRLFFKNNKSIATQKKLLRFAQFWLLIYTFCSMCGDRRRVNENYNFRI